MPDQNGPASRLIVVLICALFLIGAIPLQDNILQGDANPPWYSDWGVAEGFAISVDTAGYDLPSAIAFIPNPGEDPKDPLYFVTELRGKVKVVTNDRTIFTFAEEFFRGDPDRGLNRLTDEFGLAGICLAPEDGYVFVTFSYRGGDNKLRNNIVRFETLPGIFDISAGSTVEFPELFAEFHTDPSHQIGSCQVYDGLLYVSVGDGLNTHVPPVGLESPLGKVLRFTLAGQPAPGNPFQQDDDPLNPANYVWALGFRNPFGLKIAEGKVFVADNGRGLDRFVQIEAGEDYLWNGEDFSIATRADVTFFPSVGPAQVAYVPAGNGLFPPEYENAFYLAASSKSAGLVRVPYDVDADVVSGVPDFFLRYIGPITGDYSGIVTGAALGPDGLYFVPMLPNSAASGTVFRISHDPVNQHPYHPEDVSDPAALLVTQGCLACHSLNGEGGTLAPALDHEPLIARLQERLNSAEYLAMLDEVDQLDEEPFTEYADAREQVRASAGMEKLRVWIYYRIVEPKFDNPDAQMPKFDLSEDQAVALTDYLLSGKPQAVEEEAGPEDAGEQNGTGDAPPDQGAEAAPESPVQTWLARLPSLRYRFLPFVFLAGALAGGLVIWFYKR